tara:strand:+ start:159 stop:356 length:198 start_codon:yes stop_codon:yes gene_type:complete
VDAPKFIYHLRKKIEKEKNLIATALVDGRISKDDYDKSIGKANGFTIVLDILTEMSKNLEDINDN